uniref:DUF721 domain-containing protein n=1 Tax=Magnetococcus massalia (strain MO-1) TaxID=451514 RepID=A0A1S7LQH5_MAGMO|nr:Conserved protein of unknown function. Zn-ribbon-containing, possibly RNA-binding protein and truncated derivatives [Candidatus Magnetococcus massalia]
MSDSSDRDKKSNRERPGQERKPGKRPVYPTALKDVISNVSAPWLDHPKTQGHLIWKYWHQAVTPHIARHTEPVRLSRGVLTVRVDSPTWIQELTFLKPELLERLNRILPKDKVKDIRFQHGRLKRSTREIESPRNPLPPATPQEREKIRAIVAEVPDEAVRESLYRMLLKHTIRQRMTKK